MPNITGIDPIPTEFRWLTKTLKMWIEINLEYAKIMKSEDALYWYNERANVGALAGAAWRSGMCAVEEYTALKTPRSPTSKESGRIDLYLVQKNQSAVVEAKICWVSAGTNIETLLMKMTDAVCDARRDKEGDQKIAAVSYVVRILGKTLSYKALDREVKRIRKTSPDILAWCFPSSLRKLKTGKKEHKGYVWPGVILTLKNAKKTSRVSAKCLPPALRSKFLTDSRGLKPQNRQRFPVFR